MSRQFDRSMGYTAALDDLVAAMELAAHARAQGITSDYKLVVRSELTLRWSKRVQQGELSEFYSEGQVAAAAEAAEQLMAEPEADAPIAPELDTVETF